MRKDVNIDMGICCPSTYERNGACIERGCIESSSDTRFSTSEAQDGVHDREIVGVIRGHQQGSVALLKAQLRLKLRCHLARQPTSKKNQIALPKTYTQLV